MIRKRNREYSSQINYITCEPHSGREDILSHSGSALCMKRLENPSSGTFDKDLQVNPFLQAQGRYKAYFILKSFVDLELKSQK